MFSTNSIFIETEPENKKYINSTINKNEILIFYGNK